MPKSCKPFHSFPLVRAQRRGGASTLESLDGGGTAGRACPENGIWSRGASRDCTQGSTSQNQTAHTTPLTPLLLPSGLSAPKVMSVLSPLSGICGCTHGRPFLCLIHFTGFEYLVICTASLVDGRLAERNLLFSSYASKLGDI